MDEFTQKIANLNQPNNMQHHLNTMLKTTTFNKSQSNVYEFKIVIGNPPSSLILSSYVVGISLEFLKVYLPWRFIRKSIRLYPNTDWYRTVHVGVVLLCCRGLSMVRKKKSRVTFCRGG